MMRRREFRSTAWACTLVLALGACASKDEGSGSGSAETGGGDDDTTGGGSFTGGGSQSNTSAGTSGGDSAGTTGSADDGPATSGDDNSFLTPPDGGIGEMCDPGAQDCPDGEKCTSYVSNPGGETVDATKCVPVIGDGVAGDECERMEDNDTCDKGFFCMTDVSGHTGAGVCLEYCSGMGPCEFGGQCLTFNDGALPVCVITCDPLIQDCAANQGCYAAFDTFVCATPSNDAGADGDTCATIQSCEPGLVCATGTQGCTTESGCCTPICDLGAGSDPCPESQEECVPALDNPPPNLQDVGVCTIPQ